MNHSPSHTHRRRRLPNRRPTRGGRVERGQLGRRNVSASPQGCAGAAGDAGGELPCAGVGAVALRYVCRAGGCGDGRPHPRRRRVRNVRRQQIGSSKLAGHRNYGRNAGSVGRDWPLLSNPMPLIGRGQATAAAGIPRGRPVIAAEYAPRSRPFVRTVAVSSFGRSALQPHPQPDISPPTGHQWRV